VSFQPSEIADLLLMMVLGPVVLVAVRRSVPALSRQAGVVVALMGTGYVATVLEGVAFLDVLNLVEHVSYAAAGFAITWLILSAGRLLGSQRAGQR